MKIEYISILLISFWVNNCWVNVMTERTRVAKVTEIADYFAKYFEIIFW